MYWGVIDTQKVENSISNSYLHSHVSWSNIHNNQDKGTAYISNIGWMDKKMWCMHIMEDYLSLKKKKIFSYETSFFFPCIIFGILYETVV